MIIDIKKLNEINFISLHNLKLCMRMFTELSGYTYAGLEMSNADAKGGRSCKTRLDCKIYCEGGPASCEDGLCFCLSEDYVLPGPSCDTDFDCVKKCPSICKRRTCVNKSCVCDECSCKGC